MAPWSQRPPGRQPQRGSRGSYVPDHVRNPGKYTCYALDETLTIGGGGGGAAAGDAEQVAARSLSGSRLAAVTRVGACGAGCACQGVAQRVPGKTGGAPCRAAIAHLTALTLQPERTNAYGALVNEPGNLLVSSAA